jgi:hypothetical protein
VGNVRCRICDLVYDLTRHGECPNSAAHPAVLGVPQEPEAAPVPEPEPQNVLESALTKFRAALDRLRK